MSGLTDKISGRLKKAAGDLADHQGLREQGAKEERKAEAKEELARAQREADERAEEVARLERDSARTRAERHGDAGSTAGAGDRPAHGGPDSYAGDPPRTP
jgi:uncharacterized protein YjbJ (UPF0337 family)